MKMKYFTILIGAIALFISLSSGGLIGLGLLTGMAFGYLFMKSRATSRAAPAPASTSPAPSSAPIRAGNWPAPRKNSRSTSINSAPTAT